MGVVIDARRCAACGSCGQICPGNLIRIGPVPGGSEAAYLRRPGDCWSCGSCMKECPVQAIYLELPREMGGRGARLQARREAERTEWTIHLGDGEKKVLITNTKEANKY
ncbi:MAG: ferredoxin family protein [Firmicutes bacterium]|nr:ferredoxin family protein [Bacillota bacterium]